MSVISNTQLIGRVGLLSSCFMIGFSWIMPSYATEEQSKMPSFLEGTSSLDVIKQKSSSKNISGIAHSTMPQKKENTIESVEEKSSLTLATDVSDQDQTLSFRIAGIVSQKLVETGQTVTTGQVLYRIEPSDYSNTYVATENQWKVAQVDARQQQLEADRLAQLIKEGRATQLDWQWQRERAQQASSSRDALRQAFENSRNRLQDAIIRAPFTGIITKTIAEEGQQVSPGQPIVIVSKTDIPTPITKVPTL